MKALNKDSSINELNYGDHACLLYNDLQEYRVVALKFIADGLKYNEKVVCIIDDYPRHLLIQDLRNDNIDVAYFLKSKQLTITSIQKIYVGNDEFDPDKTLKYCIERCENSIKEGFSGLRAMGEMHFALDGRQKSIDKMIEYEIRVNHEFIHLFGNHLYLCVFNKNRFPTFILEEIAKVHPVVITGKTMIKPNPYYDSSKNYLAEYSNKIALRNQFSLTKNTELQSSSLYNKNSKETEILKHVLEAAGDGVWEIDINCEKMLIRYLSDSFRSLLGYNRNEISIDHNELIKLFHPEDLEAFKQQMCNCLKNQTEFFDHDVRVQAKTGEWIWFDIKGVPIEKDGITGEILKVVGIFNNITESKLMKIDNIKKEIEIKNAKEYDEIKTHFFSSISHDLKTPLNIILGAVQLLNLVHKDASDCIYYDKFKKYITMMRQNCLRLLRLINNLIDLTKADSQLLNINLRNFNVIELMLNITTSVSSYAHTKGIDLIFDTDIEEKIMAVDPDMIERIMLNLLSNSLKFTDKGGTIKVNILNKGDNLEVSIKDSGIGIPKDRFKTIFEKFKQVNSTISRENEGSGLGLSLVKAFVEAHDGTITVDSEVGRGTEFIITLPLKVLDNYTDISDDTTSSREVNVERISIEFSDIYSS